MRMAIKISSFLGHHCYLTKATAPFNTFFRKKVAWTPLFAFHPLSGDIYTGQLNPDLMETSLFALWSELTFMFPNNYFLFLLIFKSPKIPTFLKTSFFAVCSPLRRQGGMTRQPNFSLSIPSAGTSKKVFQQTNQSILPSNYLANPHWERKFLRKVFFSAFPPTNLYHPLFDRMIATKNQSVKCWWSIV